MNNETEIKKENSTDKKKGVAIASLIFGIIGGYPSLSTASIVAVVLGHIALVKIEKNRQVFWQRVSNRWFNFRIYWFITCYSIRGYERFS